MPRLSLLFVLAVPLAGAAAGSDVPAQLTLPQAPNIALSNSTNVREAQARLDQASGRYQQSRSALLPQLGAGTRQNFQTLNLLGIGIDLPTTSQGWIREAMKTKAARDTLAELTKLADELYRLTRERVDQGVSTELDANRAMQKVNTLEQQWQQAAQSYIAVKLSLANILQARITADFEVADNAAYGAGMPADRDAALKTARATRADYRPAEASVRAAELHVKSVKASRLPTLGMTPGDVQGRVFVPEKF